MPEQRIQVVLHVPNQLSEAGLCLLTRATCLFAKQSKEETDKVSGVGEMHYLWHRGPHVIMFTSFAADVVGY